MRSSASRIVAITLALLLGASAIAFAHATLVRSEPVAGSRLAISPARVLLVFSEALETGLAHLSLEDGAGHVVPLPAAGDPHDVHAIVAPVQSLAAGAYRLNWHVVSADGHPVQGSFTFTVGAATAATPPPPPPEAVAADTAVTWGPTVIGAPVALATLRALAVGALISLAGLLFFLQSSTPPSERASRLAMWLAFAAPVLLALHHTAWMVNAIPGHRLTSDAVDAAMASDVAKIELWRTGLAALALWALALARRPRVAFLFAVAALAASGMTGHSAAIHPMWAVPAKSVHLVASAAWMGGLLWLVTFDRSDGAGFVASAHRVSSIALASVVLVAASGILQTLLFLDSPIDLFRSPYGALVLTKVAGLLVLAAFGAYHRKLALPAVVADTTASHQMAVILRREVLVMALVIAAGALLAYVPPSMSMPSKSASPSISAYQ